MRNGVVAERLPYEDLIKDLHLEKPKKLKPAVETEDGFLDVENDDILDIAESEELRQESKTEKEHFSRADKNVTGNTNDAEQNEPPGFVRFANEDEAPKQNKQTLPEKLKNSPVVANVLEALKDAGFELNLDGDISIDSGLEISNYPKLIDVLKSVERLLFSMQKNSTYNEDEAVKMFADDLRVARIHVLCKLSQEVAKKDMGVGEFESDNSTIVAYLRNCPMKKIEEIKSDLILARSRAQSMQTGLLDTLLAIKEVFLAIKGPSRKPLAESLKLPKPEDEQYVVPRELSDIVDTDREISEKITLMQTEKEWAQNATIDKIIRYIKRTGADSSAVQYIDNRTSQMLAALARRKRQEIQSQYRLNEKQMDLLARIANSQAEKNGVNPDNLKLPEDTSFYKKKWTPHFDKMAPKNWSDLPLEEQERIGTRIGFQIAFENALYNIEPQKIAPQVMESTINMRTVNNMPVSVAREYEAFGRAIRFVDSIYMMGDENTKKHIEDAVAFMHNEDYGTFFKNATEEYARVTNKCRPGPLKTLYLPALERLVIKRRLEVKEKLESRRSMYYKTNQDRSVLKKITAFFKGKDSQTEAEKEELKKDLARYIKLMETADKTYEEILRLKNFKPASDAREDVKKKAA